MTKTTKALSNNSKSLTRKSRVEKSRRDLMLGQAKKLIKTGAAILPLLPANPGENGSGKKPFTPNGVKDATRDFKQFKRLVGSRCGRVA